MKIYLGSALSALLLVSASAVPAAAQTAGLTLTLKDGRATLIANQVPLRQILAEWARIGKTTIVNGEKLMGPPLTLQLEDRPEREVLDVLLRAASGYIVAPRPVLMAEASMFDRILIMPTSRAPAMSTVQQQPPQFNRPMPQPIEPDVDDAPVDPVPGGPPPGVGDQPQPAPGMPAGQPQQAAPAPMTRPGMPPVPQGQPAPGQQPLPPGVRPPGGGGGGEGF